MRALHLPAGEQPQLADLPTPKPTEGTVLIRVQAAGLNPIDNAIAAGMLAQMGMPHEYPLVLGRDAAGVVEAVGVDALVNPAGFTPDEVPTGTVRAGGRVASTTVLPDEAALTAE